ncbi:MAG: hypothetical protein FWC72_07240, partial [Oscillospiraceae bacterium]|nr:hypothetical protein [Oscillospiraceae bacterium]
EMSASMTREVMIRLTGFRMVGEGKRRVGREMFLGFTVEAVQVDVIVRKKLALYFFIDRPLKSQQTSAIRKQLNETTGLKGHVSVTTLTLHLHPNLLAPQSFFSVEIAFKGEEPQPLYDKVIQTTEMAIKAVGIRRGRGCPICGGNNVDALVRRDGRLQVVHMDCLQKWKGSVQEELKQKEHTTGYVQGIIGGLLGGAVALAVVFATMFYEVLSEFLGLSGILIPLGIFFGWKRFGGKHSRSATIFTIPYALALSVVSAIVNTYRLNSAMFSGEVAWQTVIRAVLSPELLLTSFLLQLFAIGISTGLGLVIIWRQMLATNKQMVTNTRAIIDDVTLLSELKNDR